ncbi:hypothetical protein F5146DRAFT_1006528 [Armillaria mellea]|nr:hypothetical protein F5146DRAFT_1006528 [Armillaria mellea]
MTPPLPTILSSRSFSDALISFKYCMDHAAESDDAALHMDAWIREAFIAWGRLNRAWLMEELGFMPDQKWSDLQMYLWFALDDLDQSKVRHSIKEFNLLVKEAFKSGVVITPLLLDMPSPAAQPSPPLLLTPHHADPCRRLLDEHSLPPASPDVFSPVAGPSQPIHVISEIDDDTEDLESAHKRLHHRPSPACILSKEKGKASQKLRTGHPQKLPEVNPCSTIKRGGYREPIPKNAHEIPHGDLMPLGLVVPDKDFRDFVGCQGTLFKWSVTHKVGHFVCQCAVPKRIGWIRQHKCLFNNEIVISTLEPVFVPTPSLVTEIHTLLLRLRKEAHQMNNTEDNIPSLFHASHLDAIVLVSLLFEKGIVGDLVDLEAEDDEDLDAEADGANE